MADDIVDGVLAEDTRVPSTNELAADARERLRTSRGKQFAEQYVDPMLAEAKRLGIDTETLVFLIRGSSRDEGGTTP